MPEIYFQSELDPVKQILYQDTNLLILERWVVLREELDGRAIPFLLFNLAIRGINGMVIHCNTMTRECWGAFLLKNVENDPDGFSTINRLAYTRETETYLKVKFAHQYPEQVEMDIPT